VDSGRPSAHPRVVELNDRRLTLSNLDLVLWPDDGITKADLLQYYQENADLILPFLRDRPMSLIRCPEGIEGPWAYHHHALPGLPPWIPTKRTRGEYPAARPVQVQYVVGSDRAALTYLLNLGCVSFHPWSSTVRALDRPDLMLFDLDAIEVPFREVKMAGLLVRDLLAGFGLRSWVKTSGGNGLHVMVPLDGRETYDRVLGCAETIARLAIARAPSLFTLDMRRARRRGRILIDVHRNHRGATLVSPYAVRERRGAPVSTPLEWSELERDVRPDDYHMGNLQLRLATRSDPMANFFTLPQSLAGFSEGFRRRSGRRLA
jgi:bifunctional non-homologous end joining protein LigD